MNTPEGNCAHNIFVRNAQLIGADPQVWLVEATSGTKGTGKVWTHRLLRSHPEAGQPRYANGPLHQDFHEFCEVKRVAQGWRAGQFVCRMWRFDYRYVEAFFPSEERAIQFAIHNAIHFLKD